MAYTTGALVSRVQKRVRDTDYDTTEIKDYLNDTQNDVFNEYRLPFMETTQGYTLTANDVDITSGSGLPSNYVQALNLFVTTSDKEKLIEYQDIRVIDENYPDPTDTAKYTPALPDLWYYYGETIRVFPAPDTGYTATLRYYKKPTLLSADADVPELPSEFEELLVVGAAYRVLQVKGNYDQAGVLENKYAEILQKLVMKYSQSQVGRPATMRINRRAVVKAHY